MAILKNSRFFIACIVVALAGSSSQADLPVASGQPWTPPQLRGVGFDQRLGAQLPLDATFRDESGQRVTLGQYFHGKPVVLVPAYYQCPRLCTQVLNGLAQGLMDLKFTPGEDFEVVTISFDPREKPELARSKKESYVHRFGPKVAPGWHFLTGTPSSIREFTQAIGFRYHFDEAQQQFVHASGMVIATPTGQIARYIYDVQYPARDLRLGLVEAAGSRIGSPVDQILLYCFHYEPTLGRYSASVMNFVRAGGVLTVLAIGGLVWFLSHRRPARHDGLPCPAEGIMGGPR